MKTLILILFLAVTFATNAQGAEKNFIDQNYIEVVGRAKMEVVPDLIYLTILLSKKDKSKQSLETIERSMKNKLKELGVDLSKDLFVKDFDSNATEPSIDFEKISLNSAIFVRFEPK